MNTKTLKENIDNIFKSEWFLDFVENTIITKEMLDKFYLNEEDVVFIEKVKRLRIPYEEIGKLDKRLFMFNNIDKDIVNKPNKKVWYLMKTKNFKKALFLTASSRLSSDLKKHYAELEDVTRNYIKSENKIKKDYEIIEMAIDNALKKYTLIIDDKIISKLTN